MKLYRYVLVGCNSTHTQTYTESCFSSFSSNHINMLDTLSPFSLFLSLILPISLPLAPSHHFTGYESGWYCYWRWWMIKIRQGLGYAMALLSSLISPHSFLHRRSSWIRLRFTFNLMRAIAKLWLNTSNHTHTCALSIRMRKIDEWLWSSPLQTDRLSSYYYFSLRSLFTLRV